MKKKLEKQKLIAGIIILVAVVITIICFAIGFSTICYVTVPVVVVCGIWFNIATDKAVKYCDKCGESLMGCAYEYQERRRERVSDSTVKVTVYIRTKCPHCGAIKEINKVFKVSNVSDNLQFQVDNYCRKKWTLVLIEEKSFFLFVIHFAF